MDLFKKIISQILTVGKNAGSVFLLAMMVVIVANVVYRMTGHVIRGSYELCELFIVVAASFALGYAALKKTHVEVNIVVQKFPDRIQALFEAFTSFLSMATWGLIAYASSIIMIQRWSTEESEMLLIPFYPFRFVLMIGLILITLVYLIDVITALKKAVQK